MAAKPDAEIVDQVRRVLADHARLPMPVEGLAQDDDLYQAGMTSHASVTVMLALEDTFEVEFPDGMLTRGTFASIGAMAGAVTQLRSPST